MSKQDAEDAGPTLDRIGEAIQRIGSAGYAEVMESLARDARHRRGVIKREVGPYRNARNLIGLADEVERLADKLDPAIDDATVDRFAASFAKAIGRLASEDALRSAMRTAIREAFADAEPRAHP